MNNVFTLFIDQYGNRFYSKTLKELKTKIPGRVSKMFVDKQDGRTVHIGYVIGKHWLTAYRPLEIPA